jgi:hypothetical protein
MTEKEAASHETARSRPSDHDYGKPEAHPCLGRRRGGCRYHPCADPEGSELSAVQYVPRSDANMALLARTERTTHCPYKGDASYFSINANGKSIENSIWTYETPFPAMTEIAGYLAFYPDKVTIEEVA